MPTLSRRAILAGAALLAPGAAMADNASVKIEVDTSLAPDLASWGAAVAERCKVWWPAICIRLASPGFLAADRVSLIIKPHEGVADTVRNVITVNAAYVRTDPSDMALVAHELVHVVQAYPNGAGPGWLIEGIADFMRYYVLEPDDPKRAFDPAAIDFRRGYQPCAALLNYVDQRYGPAVARVNAAMRAGRDGEAALTAATGKDLDSLWADYLKSRPA